MKSVVVGLAFLSVFPLLTPAVADEQPDIGGRIYNGVGGTGATASVGGTSPIPAIKFPCRSCHGRDGAGGREGAAPPIRRIDLFHSTPVRPAYDANSLRKALQEGRTPDGRILASLMPRYALDDATFASLLLYIEELTELQQRGVHPRSVAIGVAIPPDNPATARRYAELLKNSLDRLLGRRPIHGRHVSVELLEGTPEAILSKAQKDTVAVVGLAPSALLDVAAFTDRQVPVLFPLFPLSGSEDTTIVRGIMADRQDALRALADRFASDKVETVAVLDEPQCGGLADEYIRRFGRAGVRYELLEPPFPANTAFGPGAAVLLLCQDRHRAKEIIRSLPPEATIYGFASELLSSAEGGRHRMILAIPEAALVSGKEHATMLDAHAMKAARLLVSAMTAAGRGLNRTTLVTSVGILPEPQTQRNFAADLLNGTSIVNFLEMKPREHR